MVCSVRGDEGLQAREGFCEPCYAAVQQDHLGAASRRRSSLCRRPVHFGGTGLASDVPHLGNGLSSTVD